MSTVSLAVIAAPKDLPKLETLLQSVSDQFDQIVVVTDKRSKALESLPVTVIERAWDDDFAAARNVSFDACTGDVIMFLDCDDTVVNVKNIKLLADKIIENNIDGIESDYIYSKDLETGAVNARHSRIRMVKRGKFVWNQPIHENLVPLERVVMATDEELNLPLCIEHNKDSDEFTSSYERNLRILEKNVDVANLESADLKLVTELAATYKGMGRFEEAFVLYMHVVKMVGENEYRYWALLDASYCLKQRSKFESALTMGLEAIKLLPFWATAPIDIAATYHELGDHKKSEHWANLSLSLERPRTNHVTSDLDYTLKPMSLLAHAKLMTNDYQGAYRVASQIIKLFPKSEQARIAFETTRDALETDNYVKNLISTVIFVRKESRTRALQILDAIPEKLADDFRVQALRNTLVQPKVYSDKSIVIYCPPSPESWSPLSVYKGIGGSEEAVIYLSKQFASMGYEVTVFNKCGDMAGEYDGVTYKPYYHFSQRDSYNVLIAWRNTELFSGHIHAKKKYIWLHDIAVSQMFNEAIIDQVDKVIFLSQWHRNNVPGIPDEKCFITNNGINLKDLSVAEKDDSLIWSSSYDRGLLPFIKNIFPKILEKYPTTILHVAYGWQNIEKVMDQVQPLKDLYNELNPILSSHPNIVNHGRLSHAALHKLMATSSVYPYASEFGETNNITVQKMQASGVKAVVTLQAGGTHERIVNGSVVDAPDIYTNTASQALYVDKLLEAMQGDVDIFVDNGHVQFDWSETASNWIKELL
jgi:glycosyltransferase involved in cell wall biosynthesis